MAHQMIRGCKLLCLDILAFTNLVAKSEYNCIHVLVKKSEAIPVTSRGGPQGCETSRLPYFLDNPLTDGGDVSLKRRPPALYLQEDS
jgi:hypothetical protein